MVRTGLYMIRVVWPRERALLWICCMDSLAAVAVGSITLRVVPLTKEFV